jgi:hypothetical protein
MKISNYDLKTLKFKMSNERLGNEIVFNMIFFHKILLKGYVFIRSKDPNTRV